METRIEVAEVGGDTAFLTIPGSDAFPDWSPTGDLIVFSRQFPDGRGRIMAMDPDGGGLAQLTDPAEGSDSLPVFEPFGRRIAFDRDFVQFGGDASRGFVVEVAGGAERQVYGAGWTGRAWSPDGRLLVARDEPGLAIRSWYAIVDAATGEEAYRFDPGEEMTPPSWQPLPYSVSCGPVEDAACQDFVIEIVVDAMAAQSGKRVLRVELGSCASYAVHFTDGTRHALITDCAQQTP